MKRWIRLAALSIIVFVAVVLLVGVILPKDHVATRSVLIHQEPKAIWQTVTDYRAAPEWRPDVERVERLADRNGNEVWKEIGEGDEGIAYETLDHRAPHHLVRKIADEDLPFGGTWTFEIEPMADGSRVTITENGEVPNPIVRVVSTYLIGHTTYLDTYLMALGQHFGEQVEPKTPMSVPSA